jgi:hypothetical protein
MATPWTSESEREEYLKKQAEQEKKPPRYIDADLLTDKLEELQFDAPVIAPVMKILNVIELVEYQPTADVVEVETFSERIIRKQTETSDYWQNDVKQYRTNKGYSNIEHDVDNFLRGYNEAVEDMLAILDERKVE